VKRPPEEGKMTEQGQQRIDSPLQSERGMTTINEGVVSKIAGVAAGEVEGVRMGGSASRTAGGILENVTGSQGQTRGVSVEVGRFETAIDLTMGIEYGSNILERVEQVRNRISQRVENITGLRVTELNVTVSDVVFPGEEGGEGRREQSRGPLYEDQTRQMGTEEIEAGDRERGDKDTERVDLGAARAESMSPSESKFSEETIRAEDRGEDETAELRLDDDETGPRGRRREENE
jgi:uncharacterized alkaline shock family protein YloU